MVQLGGFHLPSIPTGEGIIKQLTMQEGSGALPTPVGGLFTGTNIVTKTTSPALAGKITGLAMLGGGALAGFLLAGGGGGQEQSQEATQVQQTEQKPTMITEHTMNYAPTNITKTTNITEQYYQAGGDIYGAPVSIYTTPSSSQTATQYTGQDTSSGTSGTQDQGQEATSMDMTGLIIIGAIAIGAYFLFGRK